MHDRLNELRPYVTGIRFVKNMTVVDVVLNSGWDVYKSDTVTYKPSAQNENYYMFHPVNTEETDYSIVLDHVEDIIKKNIEKENKLVLLRAKIEELKMLFSTKSLEDLERLKFVIEDISDPSLDDLKVNLDVGSSSTVNTEDIDTLTTSHKGVDLPPKEEEVTELD
jgi:hypothetical protein